MTRASDTAKLIGAGATILDGTTITTADNTSQLTLTSTDADASGGPLLTFYRNSASPADSDATGKINFHGENSAGEDTTYAQIFTSILDVTDGTEDGRFKIGTLLAGSFDSRLDMTNTETVFNEDSKDLDFRVESNGNANMINVDGGNDRVGIGMIPDTTTLTVSGQVGTTNGSVSAPTHTFYSDADTGMFRSAANEISFANGGASKQRITSTGSLVANGVSASTQSAGAEGHFVSLNDGAKYGMISGCDNVANRDAIVFTNPNGLVGTIKTNGSSTSYNTSSDYRLKENVSYSFDATSRLKQLKPARFNFIADANTTVDGFLAHEVSSIVPEAISGTKDETKDIGTIKDKDGVVVNENVFESAKEEGQTWEKTGTKNIYQNIDQSKLVPLLVKSLQEALTEIDTLKTKVQALEDA